MTHHKGKTGTSDPTYNLVSVLYHALQGAETYDMYIQDAESEGMNDLAQFFRDVQKEERHRADRAKELLHQHLGRSKGGQRAAA
jgi:rubrerythrin